MDVRHLRTKFDDYAQKYKTIRMRREDGILELSLHTDGGPLRWGRLPHAELEEAFHNIARDRDNQIVIMTGTGDEFSGPVPEPVENKAYHKMDAVGWGELGWESKGLLTNLLSIDAPMIGAVNGKFGRDDVFTFL
jgi:enoyl-CoA hydratase/carnithine racemase